MTIRPDQRTTPPHILIRPMRATDIDPVMKIAASLPEAPQWPRRAYETAIDPNSIPHRICLVAENWQTGAPVGFAVASFVAAQVELETIAVVADQQHHGIGSSLLSALVDHIKTIGGNEFLLEVRASNHEALVLYGRLGWIETGRRARYYADPQEDAVLMRRALD